MLDSICLGFFNPLAAMRPTDAAFSFLIFLFEGQNAVSVGILDVFSLTALWGKDFGSDG